MMQQYMNIKEQHKDQILFFRLGDFYEMFFDDAILVSKELELTLTGKDCGLEERAPMCGIPHHSSETYINRLIEKGYKVAICEQMENPATAKGLVKRDVIRVITPGTLTEGTMLDETKNNFIASVYVGEDGFGVSFADISTGDVFLTEVTTTEADVEIVNELSKFSPSEILYNSAFVPLHKATAFIKEKLRCVAELLEESKYDSEAADEVIPAQFGEPSLEAMGLADKPLAVRSLSGLLSYVKETQMDGAQRLIRYSVYQDSQYMTVDMTARRNLELTETMRNKEKRGTLLWVLDKTKTAMGKRLIRKYVEQPLVNLAVITKRQNAVTELTQQSIWRDELTEQLSDVYDLQRLMTKVIYGSVNPRELKALSYTISALPKIKEISGNFQSSLLKKLHDGIDTMQEIRNLIEAAIVDDPPVMMKDGGYIRKGFHAELDEIRDICVNAKEYIAQIEEKEKNETGIKNLKVSYNRVFGYYIEVTKSFLDLVPDRYIRKQTLANCERYITEELKDLEGKVLYANEKILALEADIYDEVRRFVASRLSVIQDTASCIAQLDVLCSFANVAVMNNYVCPTVTLDGGIEIVDGRHPVVEQMLKTVPFVPNDTKLDLNENKLLIITGPNMAGKSTYMRQVAIITLMAQIGSFVPARSATISIVDKIFTRVGASDDLTSGQSTFMVEMNEVAQILTQATRNSLVILDEIGRGTSTFDGMSIARAVIEYILDQKKLGCKTLFATHYHELTVLEEQKKGVKNYNVAVKKRGDDITFLRKIIRGGADESYGIEVAKLAGVPNAVVKRAKEILSELDGEKQVQRQQMEKVKEPVENEQMNFVSASNHAVTEKLKRVDLNALTPIEALNILYELKSLL
ncbi:MAG: DNA mismatch repair protein MutS [Clostridiales bacterium]|nr:DNA mismatch repair protein MutS [Clostridiales bacterium]